MFIIIEIQDSFVFGCSHFIKVALIRNYAECHILFTIMLIVVMLSVDMLSVIILSVVMLSVIAPA